MGLRPGVCRPRKKNAGVALRRPEYLQIYIETVPKRGYRFIAPVETGAPASLPAQPDGRTTVRLQKALWTNIAELRIAEARRQKRVRVALVVAILAALAAGAVAFLR